MADGTLAPLQARLRPILEAFVPAVAHATDAEVAAALARTDARLAREPAALRRQLRVLVTALHVLTFLFTLRTLRSLDIAARARFLLRVQDGPIGKLRLGVWGLRTLLFLGWYGNPQAGAALGWRASKYGWDAWTGVQPWAPLPPFEGRARASNGAPGHVPEDLA
ncbi:MAG: hypothetical protein EXR79_13585 [Myxococcales bacterium]|nr:hypothetical protein [Myxococcales bacterium]